MKIGMITHYAYNYFESLNHVFGSTAEVLRKEHEILYCPPAYVHSSKSQQVEMLKDLMLSSNVLLGPIDDLVLQVRQGINKKIPCICFLLGSMPRGAPNMIENHQLLRTSDILVVNCTADLKLAHKFFENAQVRLLPFAFDESFFYPLDEISKNAIRSNLGFSSEDKILLYSGRITVEKNVHTILRIFSIIQELIPNSRLIVAGRNDNVSFPEFGVYPLNIGSTLPKIVAKLGIEKDNIRLIGKMDRADLSNLYNIAEVLVNMTLHHDENFGLAQVEAMACGTPVIGSNWGGLKDTIVDGETGYKVGTVVTDLGVKLNWWEAVNKIVSLLSSGPEYMQLRQRCWNSAYQRYSLSQYRQNLESILADCQKTESKTEPLKASVFARQFWDSCMQQQGGRPAYKRGVSSYQLYKELISLYTGATRNGTAADQLLKPNQVLCLATPLIRAHEMLLKIIDPVFPLEITIPVEYQEVVCTVIDVMKEEPAITVERLTRDYLAGQVDIPGALEWMIEAGLILKTESENEAISPRSINSQMSIPLFSIQSVDYMTDVVVIC
jgi:glycosyltransferase involved in cell wall biosynthesis